MRTNKEWRRGKNRRIEREREGNYGKRGTNESVRGSEK